MNRFVFALMLAGGAASVHATVISKYATELDVLGDGAARATVTLQLKGSQPGRILLPVGFGKLTDFQSKEIPAGIVLKPVPGKESSLVEIELPQGVADAVKLQFTFVAPDVLGRPKVVPGEKTKIASDTQFFRHSFVNTEALTIGNYRVQALLPDGLQVQKITEQLPRPKRNDILPRVRLDGFENRQGATLQMSDVKQGDRTSMVLSVVDAHRFLGWLLGGGLIAVAYLVGFRGLVKPVGNAGPHPVSPS